MSWDVTNVRKIKASRKEHRCEQCDGVIAVGDPCSYFSGRFGSDFVSYREHIDCREAWNAHAEHVGHEDDGDGLPFFLDDDDRDDAWLAEHWPDVAARLQAKIAASRAERDARAAT